MQQSCAWLAVLVLSDAVAASGAVAACFCFCFCFMQCKNLLRCALITFLLTQTSLTPLPHWVGDAGLRASPRFVAPPRPIPLDRQGQGCACGLRDDEPLTNRRASQWRTVPVLQDPRELPYHAVGSCSPVDASQVFLPSLVPSMTPSFFFFPYASSPEPAPLAILSLSPLALARMT
ncbi:uncharacterized protein F4807DRAFT_466133 [Annulohypoxylon truncatum]|uniref:uncharacterized protein n=1 Tax=Annulohypoxylon truncatum TaxID=327061 RepID=UPI002008BC8C|nr:uncharacterized protein F4807DRAFT_466133 [Annulohypoxylon truncatum]KAI1214539.1 hypothetical protein F4807DRAFT_466133 [Annulohypoxylon truncatum]